MLAIVPDSWWVTRCLATTRSNSPRRCICKRPGPPWMQPPAGATARVLALSALFDRLPAHAKSRKPEKDDCSRRVLVQGLRERCGGARRPQAPLRWILKESGRGYHDHVTARLGEVHRALATIRGGSPTNAAKPTAAASGTHPGSRKRSRRASSWRDSSRLSWRCPRSRARARSSISSRTGALAASSSRPTMWPRLPGVDSGDDFAFAEMCAFAIATSRKTGVFCRSPQTSS
jgi:hypothetical protein